MAKDRRIKCLTCNKAANYCGLCDACRQAAYRAITAGKATRQELERKRLILPARRGRRKGEWSKRATKALDLD